MRQGIGDLIAQGSVEWARSIGDESLVQAIKGIELPMHDPRGKPGFGLSYATSPRGATHMEGMHDPMLGSDAPTPELGVSGPVPRTTIEGKAGLAVLYENLRSFTNSLVMCAFTNNMVGARYNYPEIRDLVGYATGRPIDVSEMLAIGMRNLDTMRLSSGLSGHRRQNDDLPPRFYEPLPEGASSGGEFRSRVVPTGSGFLLRDPRLGRCRADGKPPAQRRTWRTVRAASQIAALWRNRGSPRNLGPPRLPWFRGARPRPCGLRARRLRGARRVFRA